MNLQMTREDAEKAIVALDKSRTRLVTIIRTIMRKTSWRESEKAMTVAQYKTELDALAKLHRAIGEAYLIGGY